MLLLCSLNRVNVIGFTRVPMANLVSDSWSHEQHHEWVTIHGSGLIFKEKSGWLFLNICTTIIVYYTVQATVVGCRAYSWVTLMITFLLWYHVYYSTTQHYECLSVGLKF